VPLLTLSLLISGADLFGNGLSKDIGDLLSIGFVQLVHVKAEFKVEVLALAIKLRKVNEVGRL
jgi:hypothetical protein